MTTSPAELSQPQQLLELVELVEKARRFAGCTIAELAALQAMPLPAAPERAKGFVGRLVERALGVPGGGGAVTDFPECELKTLPVDVRGRPRESTFVCHVPLTHLVEVGWEASRVRAKLARVLFVPIESGPCAQADRRIGCAFLWEMGARQEAVLRADYQCLADLIARGQLERIDARWGTALQIRPKAAHSGVRVRAHDTDGVPMRVLPRAFYLRAAFTGGLLRDALSFAESECSR